MICCLLGPQWELEYLSIYFPKYIQDASKAETIVEKEKKGPTQQSRQRWVKEKEGCYREYNSFGIMCSSVMVDRDSIITVLCDIEPSFVRPAEAAAMEGLVKLSRKRRFTTLLGSSGALGATLRRSAATIGAHRFDQCNWTDEIPSLLKWLECRGDMDFQMNSHQEKIKRIRDKETIEN